METFTEKILGHNSALHITSYSSVALSKNFPIQKQQKTLRNSWHLVKTTLAVYLTFYKLVFFETLIIFRDTTIKLNTGIFYFQK